MSLPASSATCAAQLGLLGGEGGDPLVVVVELADPVGGPTRPVEDGVDLVRLRRGLGLPVRGRLDPVAGIDGAGRSVDVRGDAAGAVEPDDAAQRGPALLEGGEPGRVGVQGLHVGRELGGHLREQVRRLGEPLGDAVDLGVVAADRVQRPPGLGEQGHRVGAFAGRGRVAEQRLVGGGGGGVQLVGVGQPLLLGAQGRGLARDRVELLDLGQAGPELGRLGDPGAGLGGDLGQLGVRLAVAVVRALVVGQHLGQHRARELVERFALASGLEQLLLVGLAVHRHQVVGQVGEQRDRDRAAARERAGAPLPRHRPGQHQRAVLVEVAAGLLDLLRDLAAGVGAKPSFDRGALGARPDPGRVGAAAEQQAEPRDHHRLARAGLAGQRGEAG